MPDSCSGAYLGNQPSLMRLSRDLTVSAIKLFRHDYIIPKGANTMNNQQLDEILNAWEKTSLLEGIDGEEQKLALALCLNAQANFNKTSHDGEFNRISIPLARRVFGESKAFRRNQFVNYGESKRPEYMFFSAGVDLDKERSLQEEADFVAELAAKVQAEIDTTFADKMGTEVIFHGFGRLVDGSVFMAYN